MSRLRAMVPSMLLAMMLLPWLAQGHAQALAPAPQAPDVSITQKLDAPLPLDLPMVDAAGNAMHLRDAFDRRPVLLVLGYYRCPQLCGLLMHGLLESLHESRLPRNAYRVVGVSIDPGDTPSTAAARLQSDLAYADFLEGTHPGAEALDLQLLVAQPTDVKRLADRVGFRFQPSTGGGALFAHGASVMVVTPTGRVSAYLMGVRFDPQDLRLALVDASSGRIGNLTDRVALLCAHLDPRLGRHSAGVLTGMRLVGAALVLALGGLMGVLLMRQRRISASGQVS